MASEEKISSGESEGAFNEFVEEQLTDMLETIVNEGEFDHIGDRHSDVIIEMDDIEVPTFSYGEERGGRGQVTGPGREKGGKMRFLLPFDKLMALIAHSLRLPDLTKEGKGKIKEFSYEFKTFGQIGVTLDKKRTFKRALRSNLALRLYAPDEGRYDVQIMRRDKRYKLPERIERPKYKAVVFYMGDISYSTYGERLQLEKRLVNFTQSWLDYNYGPGNVEHRFFVHDMDAYEVQAEQFYKVSNIGGTQASTVFDLVFQIAYNEYDTAATNFYGFYFGDGELFDDDARHILETLEGSMRPLFNRIGIVEVQPGRLSLLNRQVATRFNRDPIIRLSEINDKQETVDVIKTLFGEQ